MTYFDILTEAAEFEIRYSEYSDGTCQHTPNGIYLDSKLRNGSETLTVEWIFKESVIGRKNDGTKILVDCYALRENGWKGGKA